MNIFEKASKEKYRFTSNAGLLTVEDLWDLKLTGATSLDAVAKSINKQLKDSQEESFVTPTTTENNELSEKLDIVKHVISVRLQEKEDRANAAARKAEREKIASLINKKENAELEEKSVEELRAMLNG